MKLTWFDGSTFRIQIGGQVVVVNAEGAPDGIDRTELVSGADHVVAIGAKSRIADPMTWRPRPTERLLDAGDTHRPVVVHSLSQVGVLIDGDDDRPLLLIGGDIPPLGRWAESAVIVLFGEGLAQRATHLLGDRAPRLLALAGQENVVDAAIDAIRGHLDGTGLVALEPGLAVEV